MAFWPSIFFIAALPDLMDCSAAFFIESMLSVLGAAFILAGVLFLFATGALVAAFFLMLDEATLLGDFASLVTLIGLLFLFATDALVATFFLMLDEATLLGDFVFLAIEETFFEAG
ncbi:hypothetical protein NQX30_05450 [Candidatus Persebacteraceae bacterium Df01]|uniref:Uncharacterized protein n=1 Tax=Candidatus Doriopsillibacter californiensis TaxID=2970740 RepID=A0ABT7QMG6_9GAMM|nr:hypothetical protein [Candidatus Persebacteraceae bacterium Df01]